MTTPSSRINVLLDDAIAAARADRAAATPAVKTSEATKAPQPSAHEKLSSIRTRNEDFVRLGVFVTALGEGGFEKSAMDAMTPNGLAAVKSTEDVAAEIVATGTASPSPSAGGTPQPTVHVPTRGGPNPDNISTPASPGQVVAPPGPGPTPTSLPGAGTDLASKGPEAAIPEMKVSAKHAGALLRKVSGGIFLSDANADPRAVLARYKMSSPADVVAFFKRSADRRGMSLADFLSRSEFHDLRKTELLEQRAKRSAADPDQYRLDLATAKEAVEAGIQATGALPTTSDIVQTTGVAPAVANTAQMQVAQTIVAAGGQIAAPGGVGVPEVAVPPGMGAAGGMGGMPPAPPMMVPPPGAAAPMDPAMMAPPAPMGMPAPTQAPTPMQPPMPAAPPAQAPPQKTAGARDRLSALRSVLDQWKPKTSATGELTASREETPTGDPGPTESAVTDGAAAPGSGTFELSASERAVADALATNQSAINTTVADAEAAKRPDIDGRVNTPVEAPSTKGTMTSTEPVAGTKEGTLVANVGKESTDAMAERIRRTAAAALNKASSVLTAVSGRGTSEVVGAGASITGGPSDTMAPTVKRAYDYTREYIARRGKSPEVTDVMRETGASLDDAKTGIHHASNG